MYKVMWKFLVKEGCETQFAAAYGPQGDWVKLFQKAQGYLGSELLEDIANKRQFVTIDTWRSIHDFHLFKKQWESEYSKLDKKFESFTEEETKLGEYSCQ